MSTDPVPKREAESDLASSPDPSLPRRFAGGLAMGLADAVPGVSGGTIALILGFYDRLLGHLASLIALPRRFREPPARQAALRALAFLIPLGLGMVTALLIGLRLLVGAKPELGTDAEALRQRLAEAPGLLLNPHTAPVVFAAFFGLVAATLSEPWRQRRSRSAFDPVLLLLAAALAAAPALLPGLQLGSHAGVLIFGGCAAVAAMLLPGISGSLVLLVLGLYQTVAGAVHVRDFTVLLPFLCGMALGAIIAVPTLRALLRRAHDRTMAALSGLMLGSLVALWPWKSHYLPDGLVLLGPMQPIWPHGAWWWPLLAAGLGAALVPGLRWLAARAQR